VKLNFAELFILTIDPSATRSTTIFLGLLVPPAVHSSVLSI